jgi:hypothetical protein
MQHNNENNPGPEKPATSEDAKQEPLQSKASASTKRTERAKAGAKGSKKKKKSPAPNGKVLNRAPRLFPAMPLEEALRIATAIREKNGGNPWSPDQVAAAVGISPKRTEFFYMAGSSAAYGLTNGGWKAERIELAPLGREVVYPRDAQTEHAKKIEAFLNIDVFRKVLEHYKGSNLPEMKYLGNTLERDFAIPPEQHADFSRIFKANCEYLNIDSGFLDSRSNGSQGNSITDKLLAPSSSVTLAEPARDSKLTAFVIMPFVEREEVHSDGFFDEVLKSLITPAARDAGFIVRTANRHGSDVIQSTIINDLLAADLVIADLTEHNPNVLFELGVRMANDLPICLIKASGTRQIFDVDNMLRVYTYSKNLWASTIERDLPKLTDHIKGAWETRGSESSYMKILKRGVVATSSNTFDAFPITIR